jgi:hypothetical protein
MLDELEVIYSWTDIEVHKIYSRRQVNVYVRAGVRESFGFFARTFPHVQVVELKPPPWSSRSCWSLPT